jgi:hypothetical protein
MVTTRSQSVSPRKRSTAPVNYAPSSTRSISPTPSPTKRRAVSTASPSKRAVLSGSPVKKTPRRKSMAKPALQDEIVVKTEDGNSDVEYVNGNGVEKRSRSPKKVSRSVSENKGKGVPAHKVDKSGHFEFGGSFGTGAMMFLFPVLMYYLWICSTFYGGSLQSKKGSETWLAFADRMLAHVTKVVLLSFDIDDREHIQL